MSSRCLLWVFQPFQLSVDSRLIHCEARHFDDQFDGNLTQPPNGRFDTATILSHTHGLVSRIRSSCCSRVRIWVSSSRSSGEMI
jgi:hypothetical protein